MVFSLCVAHISSIHSVLADIQTTDTDYAVLQLTPVLIRLERVQVDFLEWFSCVLPFPVYATERQSLYASDTEGLIREDWTLASQQRWAE